MNRAEIIAKFREENPKITERVVSDTVLNNWLLQGNLRFCTLSKCIVGESTIQSEANQRSYDLTTLIPLFLDIFEYSGGGVWYDGENLDKETPAGLTVINSQWRSLDSGSFWLPCFSALISASSIASRTLNKAFSS